MKNRKKQKKPTCPNCGGTGNVASKKSGPSTAVCAICMATFVVDYGSHTVQGEAQGESASDVSDVMRAMLQRTLSTMSGINISDSTIGVLNTGEIKNLKNISTNVSDISNQGYSEFANAVKTVTQEIANAPNVKEQDREELLDQLEEISRQAVLARGKRSKPAIIKSLLNGIASGLGAAGGLAEVWSTWGLTITKFFDV